MRKSRNYLVYVEDILDAIEKVEVFVAGMSREKFLEDDKTAFAVVRALEIIGEASKRIPPSVRARARDIPWKSITGMRDKLIHEYTGVNLHVVWRTATEDLPALKVSLKTLARKLKSEDTG